MGIKENWDKTDEVCESCGQVTHRVRGLTRQNLKRLVRPEINSTEIQMTLLLLAIIILGLLYGFETKTCREWLKPMQQGYDKCIFVCDEKCNEMHQEQTNYSNITLNITKNVQNGK